MSQSAFSAVLVGVTALFRRPSLLRGRGCGWRALASAASRSDWVAPGFGLRLSWFRLGCSGFGCHGLPHWVRCSWFRPGCSWFRLRCSGFGFRRLPHWVRCSWFRPGCSWFRLGCPGFGCHGLPPLSSPLLASTSAASRFGFRRLPPPLPAPRKPTGRADHSHKFHFKTLIPTC